MKEAEGEAGGAGILYLILLPQGVYLFSTLQAMGKGTEIHSYRYITLVRESFDYINVYDKKNEHI